MIKPVARVVAFFFLLQTIIPVGLAAPLKLQATDVEPPVIKFDIGIQKINEGVKKISAQVTDNVGVDSVSLYYKLANDVIFKSKSMKKTGQNTYSTELDVDSSISKKLEFYIRADDVSGNSVFEGQQFSPYVYTIVPMFAAGDSDSTEPEEEGMSTWTLILIGIGVAALAGGGGGGGGGGGEDPVTGTLTITTQLPD